MDRPQLLDHAQTLPAPSIHQAKWTDRHCRRLPFTKKFPLAFTDCRPRTSGQVGFWSGRESVGFVMSGVLYGTDKPAPTQASRGTGI